MFDVFVRSSSDATSKNFGLGYKAQWASQSDFLGYLELMGCSKVKREAFIQTGTVSFVILSSDGLSGYRYMYTKHRELAYLEGDLERIKQQRLTSQSHWSVNPLFNY